MSNKENLTLYTLGHSTRTIETFIEILNKYEIKLLVDVRTVPKSGHNPQFNSETLQQSLKSADIDYIHMKGLGGLRKSKLIDSPNTGWRNEGFKAYADYMLTEEFKENLNKLIQLATEKNTVIICAEALPWKCHRSLLADSLVARDIKVFDIFDINKVEEHKLTGWAKVVDGKVIYPASADNPAQLKIFE